MEFVESFCKKENRKNFFGPNQQSGPFLYLTCKPRIPSPSLYKHRPLLIFLCAELKPPPTLGPSLFPPAPPCTCRRPCPCVAACAAACVAPCASTSVPCRLLPSLRCSSLPPCDAPAACPDCRMCRSLHLPVVGAEEGQRPAMHAYAPWCSALVPKAHQSNRSLPPWSRGNRPPAPSSGFHSHRYNSSLPWISGKRFSLDCTVLDPFSFVLVALVLY